MTYVLIWLFCAIVSSIIASNKNRSAGGWFLLGILIGPFSFAVALLPKLEPSGGSTDRKCPYCAEMIKAEAIKCRFCGASVPSVAGDQTLICSKCGHQPTNLATKAEGILGVECPKCGNFEIIKQ